MVQREHRLVDNDSTSLFISQLTSSVSYHTRTDLSSGQRPHTESLNHWHVRICYSQRCHIGHLSFSIIGIINTHRFCLVISFLLWTSILLHFCLSCPFSLTVSLLLSSRFLHSQLFDFPPLSRSPWLHSTYFHITRAIPFMLFRAGAVSVVSLPGSSCCSVWYKCFHTQRTQRLQTKLITVRMCVCVCVRQWGSYVKWDNDTRRDVFMEDYLVPFVLGNAVVQGQRTLGKLAVIVICLNRQTFTGVCYSIREAYKNRKPGVRGHF